MSRINQSILIIFLMSYSLLTFSQNKQLEEHRRKWDTPAWTDTIRNPYVNITAATDSGKILYGQICSVCHGMSGKGDGVAAAGLSVRPANHTSANVQLQTDGSLFHELSNGHAPMPAYKDALTPKQRWSLINYIRVLGKKNAPVKSSH
ncbi:MAG: cytochrome c [Bacteroidetes bacterium]|nr:cytochrome c [Bacteroidota bacterium]